MITKDDIVGYFEQILRLEQEMEAGYTTLANQLKHPEHKNFFLKLSKQEKAHGVLVVEILLHVQKMVIDNPET